MTDHTAISLETTDPAEGIVWQAEHARRNGSPLTGRIVAAMLPLLHGETAVGRLMARWPGRVLEAAMPLRLAGGLHWLHLSGAEPRLAAVYHGGLTQQAVVDAIIGAVVADHDALLLPWFDGPPQTNEAGRSGALMGGLLWLADQLGDGVREAGAEAGAEADGGCFDLLEIGASAGANTMIDRYAFDLGGVRVGAMHSPVLIRPDWQGAPPPAVPVTIASIRGCDRAPIDLADPAAALRLKSYVWPDMTERLDRIDAVAALARERPARVERADAADWVEAMLALPQAPGTVRVLYHSIVWQYLPEPTRDRITAAMTHAGAAATADRPLAWLALETNRETFRHELRVRYWRDGQDHAALLGEAHAHGRWVRWF